MVICSSISPLIHPTLEAPHLYLFVACLRVSTTPPVLSLLSLSCEHGFALKSPGTCRCPLLGFLAVRGNISYRKAGDVSHLSPCLSIAFQGTHTPLTY